MEINEAGKEFARKDMLFAVAESGLEDLTRAFMDYERLPHYTRNQLAMIERLEIAQQIADMAVDAAFVPFIGNIVMTGIKNAYDTLRGGDVELRELDQMLTLVKAARIIFGTWE